MNDYQKYIHKSRYARYIPELGRRETWEETVKRYIHFWVNKYGADEVDYEELHEAEQAILNMEVMPSMRCLMTAGTALDRDNMAGFNPVSGDTFIVTKELGNIPIELAAGKSLSVVNKNGEWASACFTGYGKQNVHEIILRLNSNTVKTVEATDNHRWVLSNGTVVPTRELKVGDKIDFVSAPKAEIDDDYYLGVKHGLVYGDGSATKSCGRVKGYHIRLCGKSKEQLDWFSGYPVSYPPSANGDPIVMMYDDFAATHALKDLPDPSESDSYLLGFVRGWLAADGAVSKSSQVSLCVSEEGRSWLRKYAERLGFVIQRIYRQSSETNYGKRKQDSFVIHFSRSSIVEDDLLCSWKRENFRPLASTFYVNAINKNVKMVEVYCAEVPDTNTFVLEGGLVTGNCSYLAIDSVKSFDEAMYVLMCGTGVGFSVERQYIALLPTIAEEMYETDTTISVADSKIGWAKSFRELLSLLYTGQIPKWDMSKIRPAGAPLKTFGGRASGPQPLVDLFEFTVAVFKEAKGRKLNSLECHDIMCKIADIVVVGGVRRSALISLSNLTDERMRKAKSGMWWEDNPQRALSNNSVAYTEKPDVGIYLREMESLYESKSGERGVFNRVAATKAAAKSGRRDTTGWEYGTNPCSEIILRSKQVCNLSEVVVRPNDTLDDLKRKVRIATILGTLQSTLTNFRYLSKEWKKNTEEERLLGVSLTGIMDHPVMSGTYKGTYLEEGWYVLDTDWTGDSSIASLDDVLVHLREVAVETNKEWAEKLGINPSVAITAVKY